MADRDPARYDELAAAVAGSTSWRGVLRALGSASTSSSAIGSVRREVELEGLDHSHFVHRRRWTEDRLQESIRRARTWAEVVDDLGLGQGSGRRLRGHAQRLRINTAHLADGRPPPGTARPAPHAVLDNLRHAAPLLAVASLRMRGHHVSWPLEPARYDLIVDLDGLLLRVQVKTTTHRQEGRWTVWLSSTSPTRQVYASDEVDAFYVIDGDLTHYWIPHERVAGFQAVALSAYADCVLASVPA